MTQTVKSNIDLLLKYGQLLAIISVIFYMGSWTSDAESRMFDTPNQKGKVISHINDKVQHLPMKEREDKFVTRREYDITLKNIEKILEEIKEEIK